MLAASMATAASAAADFQIESFDGVIENADGSVATQAGAHPHAASLSFLLSTTTDSGGRLIPDGNAKDIFIDLPAGFLGDPASIPKCTQAQLATPSPDPAMEGITSCPIESQVGTIAIAVLSGAPIPTVTQVPLYNMVPKAGEPARFGFNVLIATMSAGVTVRTGSDYGVTVAMRDSPAGAVPLVGATITLWGVPADPAHDPERARLCVGVLGVPLTCLPGGRESFAPRRPFLANPTECESGPPVTTMRARSWQDQSTLQSASFVLRSSEGDPVSLDGCERLPFDPSIRIRPQTQVADSPAGYEVRVSMPTSSNPDGLVQAHLKRAEITLPAGTTLAPPSADGLSGCKLEEVGLDRAGPADCPDSSKVGSARIVTPVLDEPLEGAIYLAEPNDPATPEQENPFNSLFAIYIVVEGSGVTVKLPGKVSLDQASGQITTTFEDNPQLPFTELRVIFFGGPRSALANPSSCGSYTTEASFTSWGGQTVDLSDSFEITESPGGEPCAETPADRPFEPQISAGVVNPVAGAFTPFTFRLTRQDGHQEILSTEVTPPEGVTARLAGIPFCDEADADAGTCGPESRVGTAIVGAGAGPSPFYITNGEVHLAGSYDPDHDGPAEEAPISLVIKVPAIAGPFDLGVVNVRAAVYVDPTTAQLRVVSDPIPQILEGIPLRVRDIRIRMDRDHFTIAPTDCTETEVTGKATGSHGGEADLQNRFQVGECASLGFKPRLTFQAAGGKKATKRNAHPGLKANLKVPGADAYSEGSGRASQANIKRVQVTLPKGLFLDQASPALVDPCTREEYAESNCPASSKVGTAVAHTPLLDEPLEGPVYLRTGDNKLPDLVADLNGIVDIDLVGAVSQAKQRIRNTFQIVPDVPVSSFELRLDGGPKGLLVNSNTGKGLCGKKRRQINVAMRAHNGRTHSYTTQMKAACGKGKARNARNKRLSRQVKQLRSKARAALRAGRVAQAKRLRQRAQRLAHRAARG
jgi:hypothetical protein